VQTSGFRENVTSGKYFGNPLLGRAPRPAYRQYMISQAQAKLIVSI